MYLQKKIKNIRRGSNAIRLDVSSINEGVHQGQPVLNDNTIFRLCNTYTMLEHKIVHYRLKHKSHKNSKKLIFDILLFSLQFNPYRRHRVRPLDESEQQSRLFL